MSPDSTQAGRAGARREFRVAGFQDLERNPLRTGVHHRGYLPHLKREGAEYFVTFRLADSLPCKVLIELQRERAARLAAMGAGDDSPIDGIETTERIQRDYRRGLERYLDRGAGACHLRRSEIGELVAGALVFFHGQRYFLREWVVMPNHVHVLVWPMNNHVLSDIVRSWKRFTSRRAKPMLGLSEGRFWQPETYDHWVRDDAERSRIVRYIRSNPVKAGLCERPEEWRWSSAWQQDHLGGERRQST